MRIFRLICLVVLFCHIFTTPAMAGESALSVSPAILEKVLTAGESTTTKITIFNTTTFPLPVKGQASAFLTDTKLSESSAETFNAAAWFELEPADFILQPSEKKEIQVTITPPLGTEPGGHYATIYFQPLIPEGVISPESTISLARVGVLAFLIYPGNIREAVELTSFTSRSWQAFGPLEFNFTLQNSGNIHLLPIGQLEIKNIWDDTISTTPLTPTTILPETSKDLSLSWGEKMLFGRYRATLTINYGADHQPLSSEPIFVWIFPWPIVLMLIALLTVVYKLFIVDIARLKLAILVLKGKDIHETKSTPKNPRLNPRPHSRTHSSDSTPKRNHRRKSD